jgi:hypothetical protein
MKWLWSLDVHSKPMCLDIYRGELQWKVTTKWKGHWCLWNTQSISIKYNYQHLCKEYRLPSMEYILLCKEYRLPSIEYILLCLTVPMLKCWRVLVPLKMEGGFDAVITSLERMAVQPEMLSLPRGDCYSGSAGPSFAISISTPMM